MGFCRKILETLAPGRLLKVASALLAFFAPFVVVTALAGISLVRLPSTFMVMSTESVHEAFAARKPPEYVIEVAPAGAVNVPPQVPTLT